MHCLRCLLVCAVAWVLAASGMLVAAERPVDPTFLYRYLPDVRPQPSDLTTDTCRYIPLFGKGDDKVARRVVRGVARYGVVSVDPGGRTALVKYPDEEQVYFVLEGSGKVHYAGGTHPIEEEDFMYLPPGIEHGISNPSDQLLKVIVMGYFIPEGTDLQIPPKLLIANASQAKKQVVGNHPPSTLYQLLMGGTDSKRDLIAAGHVLTSLFIMEFAPGGTNHPHHHIKEEEIYFVLDGEGDMVAGGGMDGVMGKHPAHAGDAYFFRLNCTVGFYASPKPGPEKVRVLAVRSLYPGMEK